MATMELAVPSGRFLSMAEREEIAVLSTQHGVREIARRLGRSPSTISRELTRNTPTGRGLAYRATVAQAAADERARRPKVAKLAREPTLQAYVQNHLGGPQRWSPEQISHRVRLDFPDDDRMRISTSPSTSPCSSRAVVGCSGS